MRNYSAVVPDNEQSCRHRYCPNLPAGVPEIPDERTLQRMEEADNVVAMAQKKASGSLTSDEGCHPSATKVKVPISKNLENYWNVVENYQRAIARFRRPIDLDQKSWEAHNGLHELCHFGRAQKQRKVRSTDFWRKLTSAIIKGP